MSELGKVVGDMHLASTVRRKLYFVSPILTAAAFDAYEFLGLRRLRVLARSILGSKPADPPEDFAKSDQAQLRALALDDLRVLDGPFKGMIYGDFSTCSPLLPKILGVYEAELHPWILDAIRADYDCVINVGSAEGYYAVGFAYAKPGIEVFAYDIAEITDTMVPRLAALNGLQARVHKRGHCSPAELQAIASRHARPLVFVDIEGFEDALLDLRQAPALRHADIIVETHDVFNPGVTRRLIDRFWPTHRFEIIAGDEDADRAIPDIVRERISDPAVARTFVAESRGMPELWLRFKSRTPRGAPAA